MVKMMNAKNLLQGVLMGGCLAGWASLLEACSVYASFPYQTDPALWATLLPAYLGIGAGLGLLCALVLPLLSRKKAREQQYNLQLGILILAGALTLVTIVEARFGWMSPGTRTTSPTALMTFAAIGLVGLGIYFLLSQLAKTALGWMMASVSSSLVAISGLVVLGVLAVGAHLRPVTPAQLASNAEMTAPANSPNVLFVVLDTVRADHLGAYGYHRATSPNLDALAAEGVLFENAFSAAPWTLPSHASIFTGLHATTHGTGWEHPRLSDGRADIGNKVAYNFHTLAEELGQRGYQTVGVSEKSWLSYDVGLTQGFENYFDYSIPRLVDHMFVSRLKRFGRRGPKSEATYPRDVDKGGARVVETALHWLDDGHSWFPTPAIARNTIFDFGRCVFFAEFRKSAPLDSQLAWRRPHFGILGTRWFDSASREGAGHHHADNRHGLSIVLRRVAYRNALHCWQRVCAVGSFYLDAPDAFKRRRIIKRPCNCEL